MKPNDRRRSLGELFFGLQRPTSEFRQNVISQRRRLSANPLTSELAQRRFSRCRDIPIDSRAQHAFESGSEASEDELSGIASPFSPTTAARANRKFSDFGVPRHNSTQLIARTQNRRPSATLMRKVMRCVVVGAPRCGKTTILQQLVCMDNMQNRGYVPTIEDTYHIQTGSDADDIPREIVIFHDTAGIPGGPVELRRPYVVVADAFIFVYSVLSMESFERIDAIKKFLDKNLVKEKKEIPMVLVGTMVEIPGRQVDYEFAAAWASKERVKFVETSTKDRPALVDIVHYLVGRHFHPIKESKFSLSKKLKPERSNAQILMDF